MNLLEKFIMPENISLARLESSHENNVCCSGHLNLNVFKKQQQKIIDKYIFTATYFPPLKHAFRPNTRASNSMTGLPLFSRSIEILLLVKIFVIPSITLHIHEPTCKRVL